jgi:hypothetical protein
MILRAVITLSVIFGGLHLAAQSEPNRHPRPITLSSLEACAITVVWVDFSTMLSHYVSLTGPASDIAEIRRDPRNYMIDLKTEDAGIYTVTIFLNPEVVGEFSKGGSSVYKYDTNLMQITSREWAM